VWTLLKQSPAGASVPAISKAVVVCPSSLVQNWRAEFKKWCVRVCGGAVRCRYRGSGCVLDIHPSLADQTATLVTACTPPPRSPTRLRPASATRACRLGDARCDPLAVSVQGAEARAKVNEFAVGKAPVLIVSYEMLRKHADVLTAALGGGSGSSAGGGGKVGLLVCDEGHRLKSSGGNKTIAALESLRARRRVLLTGTPLQNDLSELYALASFACPGALGTLPQFKAAFQAPIEKGRDKAATPAQARIAADRAASLGDKLAGFVLRRTSGVLDAYLPPKTEATVFVALAPLQVSSVRVEEERWWSCVLARRQLRCRRSVVHLTARPHCDSPPTSHPAVRAVPSRRAVQGGAVGGAQGHRRRRRRRRRR
jgi:DNA repair and recombination protein RAD54 and RAD54-like protein